jgi:hypothetical protein
VTNFNLLPQVEFHDDDGTWKYVSLWPHEVPGNLQKAAATALAGVESDLGVRSSLSWWVLDTVANWLFVQKLTQNGPRTRMAFLSGKEVGGIANPEHGRIGVVLREGMSEADVVEVVAHESAHVCWAREPEAVRIGQIHRAMYEDAQRWVKGIGR